MDEKQIEERLKKVEDQIESLFKNDHANEIWQAKADMKFEQIILSLDSVQTNLKGIMEKPTRRIDSMLNTALTVITTAVTMWFVSTFKK
jgi:hypothetical protein